ncbi:uncharacterized protein L3040_009454 [Drepanopeziza brunnea f. sp. 'multigermtubi']|uniref:uncharacterized protein n=1 Tax=Drepanopeziza brunnea f. sp. 'multigermtubi' TaxID=698441 RepID=UPI002390C17B|nr:hypothetical protein L3040_009454 [Drepanopeziza brunnea f. sp. 'multigermtubi']
MQNLFNRHKRKHDEGAGSEDRHKKQKNHNSHYGEASRISKSMERTRLDSSRPSDVSSTPAQSRKIANLIRALDEALEEDGMDHTLDLLGNETLSRCLDLRTSLGAARSIIEASSAGPLLREQRSHDFFSVPTPPSNNYSALFVEPWKSSTIARERPPLPKVLDPTLEESSFIHQGSTNGKPTELNYERLEWVGDAYIELFATLLISQTFPNLGPGKCSQLRERLVKNSTLAELSVYYGFDKRLRMPPVKPGQPEDRRKVLGDVFEAYVAAVILSDPAHGLKTAAEWLKDLWGMVLVKDIIEEERNGLKLDSPLWKLRSKLAATDDAVVKADALDLSTPKDKLQKLLGVKGVKLEYKDAGPEKKDPNTKLPIFTVGVYLTGLGERGKMLGIGKAGGKKDAGAKAASNALLNKKLMQVYIEKKKLVEAQLQVEAAALLDRGGS